MKTGQEIALALRMVRRDRRAGELRLLVAAIVVAVASLSSVSFFTNRVERALGHEANQLLGADLVVVSDRSLEAAFAAQARARGLTVARSVRFPSMVLAGETNVLADVRAVSAEHPLRGEVRIADAPFALERKAAGPPARGTAWADNRLLARLGAAVGDTVRLGRSAFRIAAVLKQEPDAGIGFINALPGVTIHEADLAATGLIQTGSRVRHRLLVAGESRHVEAYREWAAARIGPGQRIEDIREARPEIRSALERAERFLGLASLVSVVLAGVAIALAARRFLQRHLDGCAVMRCLGASQALIIRLYAMHFLVLGLAASALGCAIGFGAQFALAQWLGGLIAIELPQPSWAPVGEGVVSGLLLLLGFALPPLIALSRVPPLRVLRRELGMPSGLGALSYSLGFAAVCALIWWQAADTGLGLAALAGFTGMLVACAGAVAAMLQLLGRVRQSGSVSWRHGIANLRRRALATTIQVVALGIGIMALLTLTLIRTDLLESWKTTLRPAAPNRFLVNIQGDQLKPLAAFFASNGMRAPAPLPMVRGRLIAINGRAVSSAAYADDRAKRLIDREFNLSWATELQRDNRIVSGRWWGPALVEREQLSVEDGIAGTLGIALGDRLTYDVGGVRFTATVTSLRKVDWDSFNVNFFVVAPPGLLDGFPASFITSFYLSSDRSDLLNALIVRFPNLLVIDVAQLLAQVQRMMDQVALAVQFVFLFALVAGLIVLYAALASSQDERLFEATVMRILGAGRRQIVRAHAAEFALVGALAGVLAAAGATALGYVIAWKVLNVPFSFNPAVWAIGTVGGAAGVAVAGLLGTRAILRSPPLQTLRRLA